MRTDARDASALESRYRWRGTPCRRTSVRELEEENRTTLDIIVGAAALNLIAFVLAYGFLGGFGG